MSDPLNYVAPPTAARFHRSNARERWLVGAVGTGKTTTGVMEILMRATAQAPHPHTRRRQSKWIVIRQSYPQLVSTTIKSFMEWPGRYGRLSGQSPIVWKTELRLPDKTILDTEVLFYAMSEGFDSAKLRSLEVTGGFLSEFAEIDQEIVDVLATRFRYPRTYTKEHDGFDFGPTWTGMWGESNAPSVNSHWYQRFEVDRPEGAEVFKTPPALIKRYDKTTDTYTYYDNPEAENIARLPGGFQYYHNMIKGMSDEAIANLVLNEYGRDMSGKPVFPSFNRTKHIIPSDRVTVSQAYPIVIGCDVGLNAAAVLTQMTPMGALQILDEVVTTDLTLDQFLTGHLIPLLKQKKYARCTFEVVIDPAAVARSAMSDLSPIALFRKHGLATRPAPTNKISPRLRAVEYFLNREGRLLVSGDCEKVINGFEGGYRYARVKGASGKVYRAEPEKNDASHPADAVQYACLAYVAESSLQEQREKMSRAGQRGRTRYA